MAETTKIEQKQEIIKLWNELNINHINFNFSCGGDSMNDTEIEIHTKEGLITNTEIENYFDNEVYNNVEFYVNSDGHYNGEFGVVTITLEDDEFEYVKSSQSEWNEMVSKDVNIPLTDKEVSFIKENVLNINGSEGNATFVYKNDVFLSNEDEEMLETLEKKIVEIIEDTEIEAEGEQNEWYSFATQENNLTINDNNELIIVASFSFDIVRDEN